jgi:hypothetical protein
VILLIVGWVNAQAPNYQLKLSFSLTYYLHVIWMFIFINLAISNTTLS